MGHVPLEVSRVIFFHGTWWYFGRKVYDTKCKVSPIPKGGLEIVLEVTFKISDEKKRYLERLIASMNDNYEKPSVSKETLTIGDIDEIHQEETNENLIILVDKDEGEA